MKRDQPAFETLSGEAARAASRVLAQHAFESEAWVEAVAAARGRPHRFVAVRALGGAHAGACLFGGVHRRYGIEVFESMPMAGYGGWRFGVALADDDEAALSWAWLARCPWLVASVTGPPGHERSVPTGQAPAWFPRPWQRRLATRSLTTYILSLTGDDEALLMRARPKARNQLRRVHRSGYACELGGVGAVPEFCDLFRAGSLDWKRSADDVMPDSFFARLYEGGAADIWRATRGGSASAAALFLRGRTEVFFQASGTLREKGEVSAIDALLWTAVRHYRDVGYETLNLGASEGLESVRFFKEKLGGVPAGYRSATFVLPKFTVASQ